MKNDSFLRLYAGFFAAYAFLSLCLFGAVFFFTPDWRIRGAAIAFSLLVFLMSLVLLALIRKRIVAFAASLGTCIDNMVNGVNVISFDQEAETLTAKLSYKLERLYEVMQSSNRQIDAEKKMIQEMISDISHQVKTPVTNLKMYNSTLLERQLPPEKEREFLTAMETQINKLDFLMQSMVNMSRLETGLITLSVLPSPIYDTIALSLGGIILPAEQKQIEIMVDCPSSITVPHDKKWTAEALFNLFDNAVKYSAKGGNIAVKVQRWETVTKIEIKDQGKGIPEQHFAQIFQRFYREEDVRDVEGVGLGLYLCREIISRQGGYIQVQSEPGKGSAFSVFLPNEGGIEER